MPGQSSSELIQAYLQQAQDYARLNSTSFFLNFKADKVEAGQTILNLPRAQQVRFLLEAVPRQVREINGPNSTTLEMGALLSALLRKKLPFTVEQLELLIRSIAEIQHTGFWECVAPSSIMRAVEERVAAQGLPASLRAALEYLVNKLREHTYYAEPRKLAERAEKLLKDPGSRAPGGTGETGPAAGPEAIVPTVELTTDEAWTRQLRSALAAMDVAGRNRWHALLAHCATATASKPAKKWLQQAEPLFRTIGADAFTEIVSDTLSQIGKTGTAPVNWILGQAVPGDPTVVHDTHSDLLRGLVWCTSLVQRDALITAVGAAADVCFKKIPNVGPRAPKIGNACLVALSSISSVAAIAQLSRLKTRAKHVSIQKQLGKALDTAAEKSGMTPAELEEVAVPTCGLTAIGALRRQLGDVTVLLQVTDGLQAEVAWLKADGKSQRSVPASVKEHFPGELKAIKAIEKEVETLLPAQRDRIERLFAQPRSWSFADFRTRFLDQPLVGVIARRLIWRFAPSSPSARMGEGRGEGGIFHAGRLVDAHDRPFEGLDDSTRVSLWHPIDATLEAVKAWRDWLEAHEVRQPFKQAHREIHVLTDAERTTGVYSNRFAAHILKQHQFGALCHERGWRYRVQGEWDSANTPTLALPHWDLRAEFWVEPIQTGTGMLDRTDVSHQFVYLYLATDQVRFYRLESPVPVPLAEVPPLAFSEVLRDVDLFVGVASVGNDPNWTDRATPGRYRDYWHDYSFGALFPSAQTRKAVLERLVPRLKIADRCSFTDRFLIVRGDLRTYKIHLGSGNIMMSPNDQYLCLVAKQGAAAPGPGKIYLPFEGDTLLSVILSKAYLLADDSKIMDETIMNQIRPATAR